MTTGSASPPPGPARPLPTRLALAAASLAVSLVVSEAALRAYVDRQQGFGTLEQFRAYEAGERIRTRSRHPLVTISRLSSSRRLVYELQPSLDKIFGGRRVRTNADGLREDRDYDRVPPASTVRIVGVGDSGMWGWAVHQGEDYLSVLEERLERRSGPLRYEVLNLAVPGYNTQQNLETLRTKGLAYSPDVVILGWCVNDYGVPLFLYRKKNHFELKGGSYL
ncbi:MAG: SGNH/GDSL hydrolase family protein, partial [Candidatus Binatia bacterium]